MLQTALSSSIVNLVDTGAATAAVEAAAAGVVAATAGAASVVAVAVSVAVVSVMNWSSHATILNFVLWRELGSSGGRPDAMSGKCALH